MICTLQFTLYLFFFYENYSSRGKTHWWLSIAFRDKGEIPNLAPSQCKPKPPFPLFVCSGGSRHIEYKVVCTPWLPSTRTIYYCFTLAYFHFSLHTPVTFLECPSCLLCLLNPLTLKPHPVVTSSVKPLLTSLVNQSLFLWALIAICSYGQFSCDCHRLGIL